MFSLLLLQCNWQCCIVLSYSVFSCSVASECRQYFLPLLEARSSHVLAVLFATTNYLFISLLPMHSCLSLVDCHSSALVRVTTCLEKQEISRILTAVREMLDFTKCQGNAQEKSRRKSCIKLFIVSCILAFNPYRYLVGVCSVLNIKYLVLDPVLFHSYPLN